VKKYTVPERFEYENGFYNTNPKTIRAKFNKIMRKVSLSEEPSKIQISPDLWAALLEIKNEIEKEEPNWEFVYKLASVKEYIAGGYDSVGSDKGDNHFWEIKTNCEDESVYGWVDGFRFEVGCVCEAVPEGREVVSLESPTLVLMQKEHDDIVKRSKAK